MSAGAHVAGRSGAAAVRARLALRTPPFGAKRAANAGGRKPQQLTHVSRQRCARTRRVGRAALRTQSFAVQRRLWWPTEVATVVCMCGRGVAHLSPHSTRGCGRGVESVLLKYWHTEFRGAASTLVRWR
eukprot:359910-Chlamydomonas_euryale.AAC.2